MMLASQSSRTLAFFCLLLVCGLAAEGTPNLVPLQPSGWSDAIVVAAIPGTTTDSLVLSPSDPLHLDWAVFNTGTTATGTRFHTSLFVDGVFRDSWFTDPPVAPGTGTGITDYMLGTLPAGRHTIAIITDSTGAIFESNESDNQFTKTVTVGSQNLAPHQPAGWSDEIVVSTVLGTNSDAATIAPGQPLFIDWAVRNSGTTSTIKRFHTSLFVDGSLVHTWFTDPPLDAGFHTFVADHQIAGLTAGSHTIAIITDSQGAIFESNESDNQYTKTINVTVSGVPDIRITPVEISFDDAVSSERPLVAEEGVGIAPEAVELLLAKAEEQGTVRVVVRLALPPAVAAADADSPEERTRLRAVQDAVVREAGIPFHRVSRFRFIPYIALEVDPETLERLVRLPAVRGVYEDRLSAPVLTNSNAVIGSATAWAAGFTGAGQVIAVLDTGVDKTHPYFSTGANKVVSEACFSSTFQGAVSSVCPGGVAESTAAGSGRNCLTTISGCDHGTHVAGIVAGNDGNGPNFGVARDANILAIQVFSRIDDTAECTRFGHPTPCSLTFDTDQLKGLERVFELRNTFSIAAVNMSLGGGQFAAPCDTEPGNPALKDVIDRLRAAGIATVIAAGNAGFRNAMGSPGCISTAISVGATDNQDNIAGLSNVTNFLSLVAPGIEITSSVPGGQTAVFSGTSMAAPHVAGAWAVLKQARPGAGVSEILELLRSTGKIVNDQRPNGTVTGLRRIDLAAAIAAGAGRIFTIHNDGTATLFVTSIAAETAAPWLSWSPAPPFNIAPGSSRQVTVTVDELDVPPGQTTTRLLVSSNDSDESPYPNGVFVIAGEALPIVTIVASDSSATEAGPSTGRFTVSRTGSTASFLTVSYNSTGTATSGADYDALPGSVTIPAGASSVNFTVTPVDDALFEQNETVVTTLTASAAYAVGSPSSATVTITSDDPQPQVTVAATDANAAEAGPNPGRFTVTRTGSTAASLAVTYVLGGTATNGSDYTTLSGNITIAAAQSSANVVVTPLADSVAEGTETVSLTVVATAQYAVGSPSSAMVNIADALLPPANVVATATGPAQVAISWSPVTGAASYRVYRSTNGTSYSLVGSPAGAVFNDTSVSAGTAYLYKVRAFGTSETGDSNTDLATTVLFADPMVVARSTPIKDVHLTQLLTAINAVRAMAGLAPATFSASAPANGVIVRRSHMAALRSAVDAARAALGLPTPPYTDATITIGVTRIKAVHVEELRGRVR
jgi:subtilisin family serine protease